MSLFLRVLLILSLLSAGKVIAQPVANFTASPTSGCAPLIVQFTSTSTGTNASSVYSWNLSTITSGNQNPTTTYTAPGTYNITLTVSGPGGSNSITKTAFITVYAAPTVSFTATPTSGCAPLAVSFTSNVTANAPGALSYVWSYGDGYTGNTANPTHTYNYANTFNATLSVTNGAGCTSTIVSPSATVFPKPSASFSATPTNVYCAVPANVQFSNAPVTGVSYSWTFGDGGTASGGNPSHTYNAANTYTVTLTAVDANGCRDTVIQPAYIMVQANNATASVPASACDSTTVPFGNISSGVTGGTRWWFGDGGFDTGKNLTHFYTASGTYQVTMVTQVGPCLDTVIKSIVINPKPVVGFSHDAPCIPGTMTFTASTSVPVANYSWVWASGGTASGNPVTKFYAGGRIDTTYLIVSTAAGCFDTIRMDTTFVKDWYPQVTYKETGCAPRSVSFVVQDSFPCSHIPCNPWRMIPCSTPCRYPHKIVSFTWWYDGVLVSNAMSYSTTIPTPGAHVAVLKTVTANGCVRYDTFYVCAGMKVKPSFYAYPDTVVCVKTPVFFQNTTGDTTIAYTWDYGSFEIDTNNGDYNGYHKYQYAKTDTVMLIATVCGCSDTAIRYGYITVRPADGHFRDSVYCPPSKTVAFTNLSVGATTNYWDFGDGTNDTAANPPPHTYPAFAKYYIRHIVWNSTYGCRDTVKDSVTLIPNSINITTDTTLCLGDTIRIFGSFGGLPVWQPGPYKGRPGYTWYINDTLLGPDTMTTSAMYIPLTRGYYGATWVIRSGPGGRCYDSVRKPNWILVSHPIAGFSASPLLGCTPMPVTFTDTTSYTPGTQPSIRNWLFGNGFSANNNNTSTGYTYTTPGKYTIKLKVTDWLGCTDSLTKVNYVEARHPTALFNPNKIAACIGENIIFTNTSFGATGLHYQWTYGDGTNDTAKNTVHAYAAAGSYPVRLIVTDSTGCSDTAVTGLPISVTHPTASLSLSDTLAVCPPLIVNFTANSPTATVWDWDFGNGSSAIIANPSSTYAAAGVYKVKLIVYDGNACTDTAYANVRVLGYAGALSYTPLAGCVPLTVNFTANVSNVPMMVWDFSSGDTALVTGKTYSYTYTTAGVYVPKLVFYDGKGCRASSTGLDTIKVDDVFAGFKVLPPCERTPLTLVDTSHSLFSALTSWRWDFGGGQIATGSTTTRVYPAAGQYPVTLIVTNARGCVDTLSKNITINPLPVITASPDTMVCVPDAVTLSAKGGLSYTWSPAATLSCTSCVSPRAAPTAPTSYLVIGIDSNGCTNKDTVKIGIQTKTTFTVATGGEICLGQHFRLVANGATLYNWTPASTLSNADTSAPVATPTVTTTYIATGREGSCAADTHAVKVIVNPLPTVDAGQDERLLAGNSVSLQASGSGIEHLAWKADPTLSCTDCYSPDASPKATTTYYVTAYTTKGCTATDSVTVRVLCDASQLFIPNTFTPNGDGSNDYFFPRGKGIDFVSSFRVYSRWGELLFERNGMAVNDEYAGWNGTFGGQKLAPDVYVYIIEALCDNGEPIMWKGDISLMR